MSVPFTQFLNGREQTQPTEIHLPELDEQRAQRFIAAGGRYESEVLSDGTTVWLVACHTGEDRAVVSCKNGDEAQIENAVVDLIRASTEWLNKAERKRFPPGIIVRHRHEKSLGVTVAPSWPIAADETPVVFEGETVVEATPTTVLVRGEPENAVADLFRCGGGQGDRCCIFLTVGALGPICARRGSLRQTLIDKDMRAKRHPTKIFPACQDLEDGAP